MKKQQIHIPDGIRYLTQWQDLSKYIPHVGKCIVNKQLPDCGASTYFLVNNDNIILTSPRIAMLRSKAENKDLDLFWYQPGMDYQLSAYLANCFAMQKPFKIIVTYDSLAKVLPIVGDMNSFQIVVDEMQCLIGDAAFKGDCVLQVVQLLETVPNVLYLSATVYPDDYLDNITFFSGLPYYELVWPDSMTRPIQMQRVQMKTIRKQCHEIIQKHKTLGYFEAKMLDGDVVYATEAVFYINSIADILGVLKDNNLQQSEVNIICSEDGERKLKKKGYVRGFAPAKGQPHVPYTFVTKASFEGADFYNTCAYTYIFCDPRLDNMALDLWIDVPQIMGRLRVDTNTFKYDATIFYKNTISCSSQAEFEAMVTAKDQDTDILQGVYDASSQRQKELLLGQYESAHAQDGFTRNYLTVITDQYGQKHLHKNVMVQIAETRAWEIQRTQYSSEIRILASLQACGINTSAVVTPNDEITKFANAFAQDRNFERRMALYCQYRDRYPEHGAMIEATTYIPVEYHLYYNSLGSTRIRALGYKEATIKNELAYIQSGTNLDAAIRQLFAIGSRYKRSDIKQTLQQLYNSVGLTKTAKATDLAMYFKTKDVLITDKDGKKVAGIEINKK